MNTEERLNRIETTLRTLGGAFSVSASDAMESLTALRKTFEEFRDWSKLARGFAWAHERSCPRHNADLPCECGLDAFLSRPRPIAEGFNAEITALREHLRLAEKDRAYAEQCQIVLGKDNGLLREQIAEMRLELSAMEDGRTEAEMQGACAREQIAEMERRNVALVEAQAEEFDTEKRLCDQIASLTADKNQWYAEAAKQASRALELTAERDQARSEDRVHSREATWAGERITALEAAASTREDQIGKIMIGGNHLASALIGLFGAGFPSYPTPTQEARKFFTDVDHYDAWICWKTIMEARDALASSPLVDPPPVDCPNCANPPHEGPCKRKVAPPPSLGSPSFRDPYPVIPDFMLDMSTEQRKSFVDRFNSASKEEIAQVMEQLPTDALEWAVNFEAMGSPSLPSAPSSGDANRESVPQNGQIVFVHGGVAEYRDGVFYTGMEDPRWVRPIEWNVTWWHPIDHDPALPNPQSPGDEAQASKGLPADGGKKESV